MTSRTIVRALPLAAVVLLGIELRLLFHQGLGQGDDLLYANLARRLADGFSTLGMPGAVRIGLYAPVALAYWLFGTSVAVTLAWPFLLSTLGLLAAYGIGRLAHGESAGLLAAFLFAVLPSNVTAGTALLGDGPVSTLSAAVVFFLLLSSRAEGWKSAAAVLASLACFALGLLCGPLMLLLLPFYVVYLTARPGRPGPDLAGAALAVGGGLVGYIMYFGVPAGGELPAGGATLRAVALTGIDAWSQLVVGAEFSWMAPLCITAVAALLAWRKTGLRIVVLWLAVTLIYAELGTRTPATYIPIEWSGAGVTAWHLLIVATPAVILTGIYLAYGLEERAAQRVVTAAAVITAIAAWAGSRSAANMSWGITGEALAELPFATLSGLATIAVVFGGIASPALISAQSQAAKAMGLSVLVTAIGLASLHHSYLAANQFKQPWTETFPDVVRFLDSQPSLPILVPNEMSAQRLDYTSGFRFGFQTVFRPFVERARIRIAPPDANAVKDTYVLVDEFHLATAAGANLDEAPPYLRSPPAHWARIAEFGKYSGNRLVVYRISDLTAAEDLAAARAAVDLIRNPSTLRHLLDAAIGGGAYCEATRLWFDLRGAAPPEVATFDPVRMLSECYKTNKAMAGPNLFRNADFSNGLAGWPTQPTAEATVEVQRDPDGTFVWHGIFRNGDGALLYQEPMLKPNTPYVQEADVKVTVPVASLYWQSDIGRFFEQRAYPEWTHLTYVFMTPQWAGGPKPAAFHLVRMLGAGEAWIKGARLSELRAPKAP